MPIYRKAGREEKWRVVVSIGGRQREWVVGSKKEAELLHIAKTGEIARAKGRTLQEEPLDTLLDHVPGHKPESLYFVESGKGGPIKIGRARNVQQRIDDLQTGNPSRLRLLGTMVGCFAKEQRVHRMFASAHIHGEWFHRTPELLEFICCQARQPSRETAKFLATELAVQKSQQD